MSFKGTVAKGELAPGRIPVKKCKLKLTHNILRQPDAASLAAVEQPVTLAAVPALGPVAEASVASKPAPSQLELPAPTLYTIRCLLTADLPSNSLLTTTISTCRPSPCMSSTCTDSAFNAACDGEDRSGQTGMRSFTKEGGLRFARVESECGHVAHGNI